MSQCYFLLRKKLKKDSNNQNKHVSIHLETDKGKSIIKKLCFSESNLKKI